MSFWLIKLNFIYIFTVPNFILLKHEKTFTNVLDVSLCMHHSADYSLREF